LTGPPDLHALHHVQLAIPAGGEDAARAFYGGVLGLPEIAKPEALHGRGGVWFERGALRLHLGVDREFRPATRAHPAFQVPDLTAMTRHLDARGIAWREDVDLPGLRRVYVDDPHGNRVELLELDAAGG
jgi:catechol 2,3-dioxygenase-like lactoylglutathione lyase family enzyme